ncbi:MAG: dienelactone hydrolase family protein [Candidatus Rokubacteria bacterium]|nr:dienelactone hydrolase family protein [Candidatus Rokubacteria bacterium]
MRKPILVLVRDLLFSSRIGETAKRLGYPCRTARALEEFQAGIREQPGLIMLDLTAEALDLDSALRAVEAAGRPAPVLGWTTHALWKTTRALHDRCDRVVTRETLTAELPDLLRGYLEGVPTGSGGGHMAIQGSMVSFESGPDRLNAHLARPGDAGPRPAVVVIQEIWGLTPHIKDVADRFAREGYVALAPDMYSREGGAPSEDLEILRKFAFTIPDRRIVADLRAACAYLRRRPEVRADRIAAIGFCMGGAWALLLACHEPIQAVADFYGRVRYPELTDVKPKHPIDYAADLRCPLLGIFAGADQGIPVEDARDLEAAGRRHGKTVEFHVYDGAPHAFFNDHRESYREKEARDAWAKTLAFFGRCLK